jgi:hypothetical protein
MKARRLTPIQAKAQQTLGATETNHLSQVFGSYIVNIKNGDDHIIPIFIIF